MKHAEKNPEIRRDTDLPLFREQSFYKFEQAHARASDPETSHKAAASVVNLGRTREGIIKILKLRPCTDEQIAKDYEILVRTFGWPKRTASGLRSRRKELCNMGFVESCGEGKTVSGRACQIWRLK